MNTFFLMIFVINSVILCSVAWQGSQGALLVASATTFCGAVLLLYHQLGNILEELKKLNEKK